MNKTLTGSHDLSSLLTSLGHTKKRKLPSKGTPDRRIINVHIKDNREHYLHVTKGWKSRRLSA